MNRLLSNVLFFFILVAASVSALADININYYHTKDSSYILPILSYEKNDLYFESRYNYEDFNTLSFFLGKKFILSEKYNFEFIPILGGAVGNTEGVIPGFELSITFGRFNLESQQEFLIDLNDQDDSFYYIWTDFKYEVLNWFDVGVSAQRLNPYLDAYQLDYGVFGSVGRDAWWLRYYYYLVGDEDRLSILSLDYAF